MNSRARLEATVPGAFRRLLVKHYDPRRTRELTPGVDLERWPDVRTAEPGLRPLEPLTSSRRDAPSKLRVVYLDHVAKLSGGELALVRLVNALSDVEEAHVILAEEGPLVDHLLQAGISTEVLPMQQRTRELRKDSVRPGRLPLQAMLDTLTYTMALAWRLRRLRPDVVHTNSLKSGIYGSIAARLAGAPVVWHLRDRIDTDYLPRAGVLLVRVLTRYLAHVVICNSVATSETLRRSTRSMVIPSGIALAAAGPARSPQDGPLVAGIIGRLAPWKGQDVFLRAFARAFPEGNQRAVIVGAPLFGESEVAYADDLRRLADELGIAGRVEFRGHREDIAKELRALDVLVHASTIPEPFGQVVIEGMSASLPVVASRGGGPEEIISEGIDGLLYPAANIAVLSQILTRLDADPELRMELGRAGAHRARDFSPEAMAKQVMRAYELARRESPHHDPQRCRKRNRRGR